ncbi:MAG: hypothetical protein IT219_01200 [Bacteroidales bacterium]|jgi:hypothetical protein|nr:hypothetical protein [Bacteroidales bacterium]
MIEENIKIHNRFSIELKLSFLARKKKKVSEYAVNTWIFVPNSLDINPSNYDKSDFYRDLKSNIRLITPVFLLRDIVSAPDSPFVQLEKSFQRLASEPTRTNTTEYEHQIKLFLSIVKSALRDETNHILQMDKAEDTAFLTEALITNLTLILSAYRKLWTIINAPTVSQTLINYYRFGDEFLSNIVEQRCFRLLRNYSLPGETIQNETGKNIYNLIKNELKYKKENNYPSVEKNNNNLNRQLIHRLGLLKKYAEDVLFLSTKRKKEGVISQQIYYSIAAGISMVFATAIAFSFQQKYGNLTMPFFVALVVSYMLKDRIKELARYYFAHKLGNRYFDHKTSISLKNNDIGWSKEAMDFITESKVPQEVLRYRNRSAILEADNRNNNEKIILYRKMVRLNRESLDRCGDYFFSGINDIIRLNVNGMILKMDDPEFLLHHTDKNKSYITIQGEKIYYLNLIMQMKSEEHTAYRRYRVAFNRNGIVDLEFFKL